jgi:hypothetical protein
MEATTIEVLTKELSCVRRSLCSRAPPGVFLTLMGRRASDMAIDSGHWRQISALRKWLPFDHVSAFDAHAILRANIVFVVCHSFSSAWPQELNAGT